ncbi:tripartite tricarboxylate transporter substrate binding protein [Pollutimonas sp. M17]|uniref:tripartite tricarboxylate transporter substrate binding protein n=1 Tax=Pollutimonas sp. M17 TaxID=2962065 RepID=UPI0021F3EE72|nr:tripartite tricarboxylate transporter substrate binding protein [Pollutimonas sp. M17]UYO94616.1 tripartite tricarboxylate transporter substrate binding protein [Pollutimonas sp. M17]
MGATTALAEATFPSKPIRIIMPFSPGGGGDMVVRSVADRLGKRLGVPVIIDSRPGASGFIGAQMVAEAPADGYTLLMGFDGSLVVATNVLKPPFHPISDLAAVTKLADSPLLVLAHPSFRPSSIKELVDASETTSDGLPYGSAGRGTTHHLVGELLTLKTGAKLLHVPYKGGAAAIVDAVGGQIPLVITVLPTASAFIKDGKLRPIAVTSRERVAALPDVPTMMEEGVPDFDVMSWYGIFAPAGTPPAIVEKLQSNIAVVLEDPQVRDLYLKAGFIPSGNNPSEFAAQVQADYQRWAQVVKAVDMQPE